jgi:hypothetical protein
VMSEINLRSRKTGRFPSGIHLIKLSLYDRLAVWWR